jgi:serine protease inhibitor
MSVAKPWAGIGRRLLAGVMAVLFGGQLLAAAPEDQAKLVAADTGFAFRLLKELAREQPGRNVFISPYSISAVLQIVCNGAGGNTREEMAQVLGTSGIGTKALGEAYKELAASVRSAQAEVTLNIANAIWYSVGVEVKPVFAALNRDFYEATMDAVDFTDPRTAGFINAWTDKQTSGRIKNVIAGRLPGDTSMVLANAIYFKGSWERKFDPKATKLRAFHASDARQAQVPMMAQSGEFEYRQGNGCQAVRLPYKGLRLGMYVLLPETNSSPGKRLATLNDKVGQEEIVGQLRRRKGSLILPRFKLEYGAEMKQPLQALGMILPFSMAADFSGMSSRRQLVSAVKHKSFVEVNEEGTEAAAATVAVMKLTAMPPMQPFEMTVDRPFLFVIADNVSNAILFVGLVYDPASGA